MAGMDKPTGSDAEQRRQAEARARGSDQLAPEQLEGLSPEATRQMLHELRVHQIELGMQNEELRRAQVEIEVARTQYFDLYDLAPVGYCTVDQQGMVLQANLTAATLLGLSRTTLVKQPLSQFILEADQDSYYLCRKQLLATGQRQQCELRMVVNDGAALWVQLVATLAHDADGADLMRVVLNDIGDRKLMQAAMQESEQRYRTLVRWSPEVIVIVRHGNIVFANPAAVELFGARSGQALLGQPAIERVDPEFHALVQARTLGQRATHSAAPMIEVVMRKLDGSAIGVEVQSIWIDYDGQAAIQVAMHDVTERVRLARELRERNIALERATAVAQQANRAKSNFLSSLSHELRTPLSAMLGFAQLIDAGTPAPTPAQKRSLDQILLAGWHLLELINEILDLALIESGKLALALEPVALADVLRECRDMVEPQAQECDVSLLFPRPDIGYFVQADRTRMRQVLINLLSNAIKYNRSGGAVVADCSIVFPTQLRIRVSDTGAGLAPDQLAQLFEPFNRLGQEASAVPGTGIGLVVCKRLVEAMGGSIGVESTPGKGSVFWVDMPLAAQAQAAPAGVAGSAQATALAPADAPPRSVLYVEDNDANLMLIEDLIARRPELRFLSARDGTSGVAMAREHLPDVVLMDVHLPDISGVDAMKMLRADPVTAHIPVIALSANAMARDIAIGLEAGFIHYLTKPIKVVRFMDVLDQALNSPRTAVARASGKEQA